MIRVFRTVIVAVVATVLVHAATLEKLGMDEMIQKSTVVVRARVSGSYAAPRGPVIYTHYRLEILERWKGSDSAVMDVVVPGGATAGLRQTFSGAPTLGEGREYVLFLWTSKSGLTHIIGLTQGLFDVTRDSGGKLVASRPATTELMLDASGRTVRDEALNFRMSDLRQRIARGLAEGVRK